MAAGDRPETRDGLLKADAGRAAAAATERAGTATRTVQAAARTADEVDARRVVAI